jgi:hypothetical protein
MFRALLAHLQEALHKRNLVYCIRVMSVDRTRIKMEPHNTPRIPSSACVAFSEDEQVVLETFRDP